jgi:hypothetical protein
MCIMPATHLPWCTIYKIPANKPPHTAVPVADVNEQQCLSKSHDPPNVTEICAHKSNKSSAQLYFIIKMLDTYGLTGRVLGSMARFVLDTGCQCQLPNCMQPLLQGRSRWLCSFSRVAFSECALWEEYQTNCLLFVLLNTLLIYWSPEVCPRIHNVLI